MKFIHRKYKNQLGFSNVQIAVGILVVVIGLIGSIAGYQYVYQAKVNNDLQELTSISVGVKRYKASVSDFNFGNSTPATFAAQGWIPQNRVRLIDSYDAEISSQWSQRGIRMNVSQINNNNDAIQVTYFDVPDYACKELAIKAAGLVDKIDIDEASIKTLGTPIDVPALINVCNTNGFASSGSHAIVYTISTI